MTEDPRFRRPDVRESTRRDLDRFEKRRDGRFWRSLALVGSVGWPIVLSATGGAWLGRLLDQRFDTGIRLTFILLTLGTAFGSWVAYRALRGDES